MAIKQLPEAKKEWQVASVWQFISEWKLEKQYKKLYGNDFYKDWDTGNCLADSEIIYALLKDMKGSWTSEYVDDNNMGYFIIKKY